MNTNIFKKSKKIFLGFTALVMAAAIAGPALADWNYITLSSYYVLPGQSITVSGAGFAANEAINISLANNSVSTTANSQGVFTGPAITVPNSAIGSNVTVTAQGNAGHTSTASLVIGTYYPHVTPSSYFVNRGSTVSFSGIHFGPNEAISIMLGGSQIGTATTTPDGSFSTAPFVVTYAAGDQTFTFTGQTTHTSDTATVKVSGTHPVITLSTYYAPAGTPITINGQFFGTSEKINLNFGGTDLGTITTTAAGTFSFQTTVPATTNSGTEIVSAISNGGTAQQNFTPNVQTGVVNNTSNPQTLNSSTQVSIVSIDRIKNNLNINSTETTITPKIISTGGDTTNVTITVQLLNSNQQISVQQTYPNQTLNNNTPADYPLTTPSNLQAGNYDISVLIQNSDNTTKALFPNLGGITVQ